MASADLLRRGFPGHGTSVKRKLGKRCALRAAAAPGFRLACFRWSEVVCGQGQDRTVDLPLFRCNRPLCQPISDLVGRCPRCAGVGGRLPSLPSALPSHLLRSSGGNQAWREWHKQLGRHWVSGPEDYNAGRRRASSSASDRDFSSPSDRAHNGHAAGHPLRGDWVRGRC
jgi:hypothetical protein